MQAPAKPTARPAPGVVFDCDMGNRIDDVLALAVLYGLDTKNDVRVISVSVSKANLKAAAFADAIMRFYASAGTGQVPMFVRTLPVGFAENGVTPEDTKLLTQTLSRKNADGKPVFSSSIEVVNDTAECSALVRNALTAQHDDNAIVVLTGPATNLAKVLDVPGAKDFIRRKVRHLVMTCGQYPSGEPEFNIATDVAAAKKVLAGWPSPIVTVGKELAGLVKFPGASIQTDYAWATVPHPVVEAYRAYEAMPYDAPALDAIAVLYASRPNEAYFKLSEPGEVRIREDGGTEFVASANGKHRHLIVDAAQKDAVAKTLAELASTKPVIRRPRRPPMQQQKQELKKPPEAPKPPNSSA